VTAQKLEARVPPDRHHGAPAQLWLCGGVVVLRWTGRQWKKWRVPVKYIVTPAFFAASTTSSSRTEPPGWTTALTPAAVTEQRPIEGGLLVQVKDRLQADGDDPATWTLASGEALSAAELAELAFAWRACRAVKSNAILLAKDGASVGVGMGQVNRVDSAKLAVARAGAERAAGSYAASDAFFPFPDGFEVLAEAGVKAVVQPGGSVRDELVVEAAQKAGVTMYFTGTRHFFH